MAGPCDIHLQLYEKMKYSIALFGGVAATAIIYFMLIKGLKDSSFMTPENKHWIQDNTLMLIAVFFVFFTVLMQILHWMKINVFKVIVLMGTFALALALPATTLSTSSVFPSQASPLLWTIPPTEEEIRTDS